MNNRMWMVGSIVFIAGFVFWLQWRVGGLEANVAPELEDDEPMLLLNDLQGDLGGAVGFTDSCDSCIGVDFNDHRILTPLTRLI